MNKTYYVKTEEKEHTVKIQNEDEKFYGYDAELVENPTGTLVEKTITANGEYLPASDNADGYSKVTVDVQSGGNQPQLFAPIVNDTYTNTIIFSTNMQNGDFAVTTKATIDGLKYTSPITITVEMDGKTCRIVSSAENFTSAIYEKVLTYVVPGEYSEGLSFLPATGGYKVSGIGSCKDLDIRIPPTYNGQNVVETYSAFNGNNVIRSVAIPSTVTKIDGYTFKFCTSLSSVSIQEGVTTIDYQSFYGCTSLTNITIPNSVTNIVAQAFRACGLTSVNIGNGVTYIGTYAFLDCRSLVSITIKSTTPPTLESNAFSNIASNYIIRVPPESVNDYKTATNWVTHASHIQAIPE